MIKRLTILFIITCNASLVAQIDHVARYESLHNKENIDYLVIPNEDKGVLLVKPVVASGANESKIEFSHLGSDLKEKWSGVLETDTRQQLKGYYYADNVTYLLLQVRSDNRFIRIMTLNTLTKEVKTFEPKQITDLSISEFEVINGSAVIGGYIEQRPAVFVYNMEKDEVNTLSNVYQNDAELFEVKINSDSVTFNVLVSQFDEKRDKTVLVSTYDYGGNPVRSYQLEVDRDYQLLSAVSSSVNINDKSQVVVGLYGIKVGTYPSGIFINHVDRIGQQTMKYVNFGEFDTFLNHNGKKRSAKMKAKALSAKQNNKDWRYKIDAVWQEMIEQDGQLMISGEFFKPWTVGTSGLWRNRNQLGRTGLNNDAFLSPYALNNSPGFNPTSLGVSTDLDYTHAFALVLDWDGNIQWDGALDINEDVGTEVTQLGAFQWHEGKAFYAYHYEEELRAQYLNDADDTEGHISELKLNSDEEKLSKGRGTFVRTLKWHENKFLLYGIHYVRPTDKSEGTRKVFFINAVTVGPNMPEKED